MSTNVPQKFGRNYVLTITKTDGSFVIIRLPFTVEFDIQRRSLSSAANANIRGYNLNEATRNFIRFNISDIGNYVSVVLQAGYGTNLQALPIIFSGNLTQAWSVREGSTFITTIEALDGGFAFNNSRSDGSFIAGTTKDSVIRTWMGDLDHVTPGAIGPSFTTDSTSGAPIQLGRGNPYSGPTVQLLKEQTGGEGTSGFFVDLQTAHCLSNNEYINSEEPIYISSATGLLATPVLEETIIHFDMLFEPTLKPGYSAYLDSSTEANYNGLVRITAVSHRGMISEAVCGDCVTTAEFFYDKILTGVPLP